MSQRLYGHQWFHCKTAQIYVNAVMITSKEILMGLSDEIHCFSGVQKVPLFCLIYNECSPGIPNCFASNHLQYAIINTRIIAQKKIE